LTSILVTGASGFIGRHLVPELRATGHEVVEAHRSLGDVADASTWSGFRRAEVVIHLAGKSFVPDSWADPVAFIRCNLLGTVAALDFSRQHGARLVYLSSYLYGEPERLPIPESAPLVARNPYALSKKLAEEACRFYAESFGVTVTVLRPFNVYGPGQAEHFLIPSIVRQVKAGGEIRVKDLEPKRDYVHVRDVVHAIARAIPRRHDFGVFNVGSGTSHSVAELIQTVQETCGTQLPVRADGERRKDEIMDTVADISEAARRLQWRPRFTLREGMRQMLGRDTPAA